MVVDDCCCRRARVFVREVDFAHLDVFATGEDRREVRHLWGRLGCTGGVGWYCLLLTADPAGEGRCDVSTAVRSSYGGT